MFADDISKIDACITIETDEAIAAHAESEHNDTESRNNDATDAERKNTAAPFWKLCSAKDGSMSASENGALLHSSYNPAREAEAVVAHSDFQGCTAAVFYSFGLGYTPVVYAKHFPNRTLLLVEPDALHFFAALTVLDWTPVFSCSECIIALNCDAHTVISLIEKAGGVSSCAFFSVLAQTAHAQQYFDALKSLVERNKRKDDINTATLERFSKLWLRNSCINLDAYAKYDGVRIYENNAPLPFTIVAAGPSLETMLPYLAQIQKRSVLVCVDTAIRACVRAHVEPDFIIIGDPQYYEYRHIAGLRAPSSVLIAEPAVYPAVFRFQCRKLVLTSSLFPLGNWFEKRLGQKGSLGAGGSVASNAWNFAYLAGSREIYCCGLDLSFPQKQTHIKGSSAEESFAILSRRTHPIETQQAAYLFSAGSERGTNYNGNSVLTDSRMNMFAWWFESRLAACSDAKTYTLCPEGLAIPGIQIASLDTLLAKPCIDEQKKSFLEKSEARSALPSYKDFAAACNEFSSCLDALGATAEKGTRTCEKALSGNIAPQKALDELSAIDSAILESSVKDAAALVFPTERQLEKRAQSAPHYSDAFRATIARSLLIYTELLRAIGEYKKYFNTVL